STRSARLRHVGTAAAALAAQDLRTLAHEIDRAETLREIGRHAHHKAGLAVLGDADDGNDARTELLLALVGKPAQVLQVDALDGARHEIDVADLAHAVVGAAAAAAHGDLLARFGEIALQALAVLHQGGDALRHVLERNAQLGRSRLGEVNGIVQMLACRLAGQRLDAAHAGAHGALGHDRDETDVAGARHVSAAAQLDRPAHRVV